MLRLSLTLLACAPLALGASGCLIPGLQLAECGTDGDCRGDDVCSDGLCVECERDSDCDDDEVCDDGDCEADTSRGREGEGEGEGEGEPPAEGEGEGEPPSEGEGEGEGEGEPPAEGEGEGEGEGEPPPPPSPEDSDLACLDGVDNDQDTFFDCDDFDCSLNPSVTVCPRGGESSDVVCSDGVSNDGDQFVDCDDFDCSRNVDVGVCGSTACGLDIGSITGNVFNGTLTGFSRSVGGCGGNGPEQILMWTAPFSGTFQIDNGGSFDDTVIYARDACGSGLDLACDASLFGGTAAITLNMNSGQLVFIVVDAVDTAGGSYSLNITAL